MNIARTLILANDYRVLVLKTPNKIGKRAYSDLPGGKIEKNETPKAAARREIQEETGLTIEESDLKEVGKFEYYGSQCQVMEYLFCAILNDINKKISILLNSREHENFKFCKLDDLDKENFHPQILSEIIKSKKNIIKIYTEKVSLFSFPIPTKFNNI